MEGEKKCFTITLRIENYNFSTKLTRKPIESPQFLIDGEKNGSWILQLWPKSSVEEGNISFYVSRKKIGASVNCEFNFEIDVFADDDSSATFQDTFSFTCKHNDKYVLHLIPHHKIYTRKNGVFFPPKTLAVRCKIYKTEESFSEIGQYFVQTRLRVEQKAFMVLAENFSNLVPSEKKNLTIKSASAEDQLFVLNLTLVRDLCCKEKVWIEVIPTNKRNMNFCVCKVFLLDSEALKTKCGWSESLLREEEWKFQLNFTKDYLMQKTKQFLPNDTLTLKCEFVFCTGIEYDRIEDSEFGKITTVDKIQSKFPSALEDMTCLFKEGFLCDMKLRTETETFNVHKNVLSARSPVFKAMFTTDMREKTNDCVVIEDLEADTVRRMLMFMYSDNLDELDWELAKALYFAADKYHIAALKHRCSEFLKNNLQQSDSCDLLLLSDRHQDEELKTAVQKYIAEHHEEILQTDQWMSLEKSNPALTTETFRALYMLNWKN